MSITSASFLTALLIAASSVQESNGDIREGQPLLRVNDGRSLGEHYQPLAGYTPKSKITDVAAIDLDQLSIRNALSKLSTTKNDPRDNAFEFAEEIYIDGGHSLSVAFIDLDEMSLVKFAPKNTLCVGKNAAGETIRGYLHQDYDIGSSSLRIEYEVGVDQETYMGCQVGELHAVGDDKTDGCFAEEGSIVIDGNTYKYSYDVIDDNSNKRTISHFSTKAEEEMLHCDHCPLKEFNKFNDYYGDADYAHQFIMSAFEGENAYFQKGNQNFALLSNDGRANAILGGIVFMSFYMKILALLEKSLATCTTSNNNSAIFSWDSAAALYIGSLEGKDGTGRGVLLFGHASYRCTEFKTCGDKGNDVMGEAKVNLDLLKEFRQGQRMLEQGKCEGLRGIVDRVGELMMIPLVQGTLRMAYRTDNTKGDDMKVANSYFGDTVVYSAAILPRLHYCDEESADVVYQNMRVGAKTTDFNQVKLALEKNYQCLGLTCEDIGGIYSETKGKYRNHASPCLGNGSTEQAGSVLSDSTAQETLTPEYTKSKGRSGGEKAGIVFGFFFAVSFIALLGMLLSKWRKSRKQQLPVQFSSSGTELQ